jgi:hypothetical protein
VISYLLAPNTGSLLQVDNGKGGRFNSSVTVDTAVIFLALEVNLILCFSSHVPQLSD